MKISVIMPAHNASMFLGESLSPLMDMLWRGEIAEVLVVDDASTDDSAAIAADVGARVIAIENNQGPAGARNRGAVEASGDVLWFVDADVTVHDDAARQVATAFHESHTAAVVGSYDDQPRARNFFSQYKNLVHHFYHQVRRGTATVFWAGCGAIRAADFARIGGFDAARFPLSSIEDIEVGYRLSDAGGVIAALPGLQGTHLKVWRFPELLRTEIFRRALPWSRLLLERGRLVDELNVSLAERGRALLAFGMVLTMAGLAVGLSPWWLLGVSVVALGANFPLLALFARVNGLGFALRAVTFHQVYYVYSSAAFTWAWLERLMCRVPSS